MSIMSNGTNLPTSPAMLTLKHQKKKPVEFSPILHSIAFNPAFSLIMNMYVYHQELEVLLTYSFYFCNMTLSMVNFNCGIL